MSQQLRIGIIGEFDPDRTSHVATNESLSHAANELSVSITHEWLQTVLFEDEKHLNFLKEFDALWCAPGIPESTSGVLNCIKFARENLRPFIGT